MIAKARAVSHGNAYTTYSSLKKDSIFIGSFNMDCDTTMSLNPADDAWEEFRNESVKHKNRLWEEKAKDSKFFIPRREVTNTLIAMEVSPSMEESKDWITYETDANGNVLRDADGNPLWHWDEESWRQFGLDFLAHMDNIKLHDKEGNVSSKKTNLLNSKCLMMLHTDAKSGIPHLHIMVSRFDMEGWTNCANLIGEKAVIAANQINQEQGWKQSREIGEEHKAHLKDAAYNVLHRMNTWNLQTYFDELEADGVKTKINTDSNGRMVNYSFLWGNSRYAASAVGAHLTIAKLQKEWKKIHEDELLARNNEKKQSSKGSSDFNSTIKAQGENASKHSKPMIKTSYTDADSNKHDATLPKHIYDIIKENIDLPEESDYENEEVSVEIPDITEAISLAVGIMFELLAAQNVPTSAGGGGGPGTGWRDKDDDKWKDLALLAAQRASARCTPAHSKPKIKYRSFRR